MNPVVPAVVIGGAVYVLSKSNSVAYPPGKTTYPRPGSAPTGSNPGGYGTQLPPPTYWTPGSSAAQTKSAGALFSNALQTQTNWTRSYDPNTDPELQRKADAIEALAKKTMEDMNEVEKAKAADYLNKELKLDPPLNGHEDWKTISGVVGGVAGAAAGTYICGPVCGKLGAIAGAYLGVKLEELMEKSWDEVKSWVKSKWNGATDWLDEQWDDTKDWVSGIF